MKKLIYTILTSLTVSYGLNAQTSDNLNMLLITSDSELPKYYWSCPKLLFSDTLLLDKDSILLTKGIELKNECFFIDTTFSDFNKLQVVFDNKNKSFVVFYFDFLKSVKNRTASNRKIYFHVPYKSDSLKWSFEKNLSLLKITSIKNISWTFLIKEIDKNNILLIKTKS